MENASVIGSLVRQRKYLLWKEDLTFWLWFDWKKFIVEVVRMNFIVEFSTVLWKFSAKKFRKLFLKVIQQGGHCPGNQRTVWESEKGLKLSGNLVRVSEQKRFNIP